MMYPLPSLFSLSPPPPLIYTSPPTPTQYKAVIAVRYSGVCCVCKFGVWTCLS